jgi:predicted RNA-binding Zn-ribbon protein involved in translation (DUF1610 family)
MATLSNGEIISEERHGWALNCPSCGETIRYTILNVVGGNDLFLYSEKSSNFVLRSEDCELAKNISDRIALLQLYRKIEKSLPATESGRQFKLERNVCCPKCGSEFPYQYAPDSDGRLYENKIIWIEGAVAFRGVNEPSNKLVKVIVSS